ncbi:MAG: hypothetical protein RL514_2858 [Verrucomicrobiota bacterium]|jgi:hypothetical protein
MKTDLNKYLTLKAALLNERAEITARLNAITKVLGQEVSGGTTPAPTTPPIPGKRTFSAATKAKMALAQKARWAAKKPGTATVKAVAPGTAKQPKRSLSEATKAKMRAAHQARWAKVRAKSGSAPAPAPASKNQRKMSAEGRANIIAATKARWAKVNALKAKSAAK